MSQKLEAQHYIMFPEIQYKYISNM